MSLDVSQPYRASRPVTGIALPFNYEFKNVELKLLSIAYQPSVSRKSASSFKCHFEKVRQYVSLYLPFFHVSEINPKSPKN
jgi:hypothetical protein